MLAALALAGPEGAGVDDLAEAVWGPAPPATAAKTIQNHVRRIRQAAGADAVETLGARYRVGADVIVDAEEVLAVEVARHDVLASVLERWRGAPFADLPESPAVVAARQRLATHRSALRLALAEHRLAVGEDDAAAPLLALLDDDPYDEHAWWLLAIAHYRAGRRRESMQVLGAARERLAEVGLPPGPMLLRIERLIAGDDPALHRPALLEEATGVAPVFVGRDRERVRLSAALGGPRAAAVISGEPGAGKTSLARVVAAAVASDGALVLWGDCDADPSAPLAPIRQLVGELPPATGPQGLFDAVAEAVRRRAGGSRVVAFVDDAHLAGPTTLRLLAHLRDRVPELALVVTSRSAFVPGVLDALAVDHPLDHVELPGFAVAEVQAWLDATGGATPGWAHWLHEQAGGNPLLLGELARAVDRHGPPPSPGTAVLPVAIQAVLLERLGALTAAARQAVQAAAVLGVTFPAAQLDALTGGRGVPEAIDAGLLVPAGAPGLLRFGHALVQQAAYSSLSDGQRVELHDAAASVVAAGGDAPGELARHRLAAAALDPVRAVAAGQAAARAAAGTFAFQEAVALLDACRSVAAAHHLEPRLTCELEIDRGEALRRAGAPDPQPALFAAAERAAALGEGDLLAKAALTICNLGVATGAGATEQRIIDVVERGLAAAGDAALRAELAGAASWALAFTGQGPRCRSLYERAEAEARALGSPEVLGQVLPYALLALNRPDDFERKAAIAEELEAWDDPVITFHRHQLRFTRHLQLADPACDDDLAELRRLAELTREPQRQLYVAWYDAARRHLAGDLDGSEAVITAALDHGGAVPDSTAMAVYGGQILAIRAAQGRLAELLDVVSGLVDEQPGVRAWSAAQAWIAATLGDVDLARTAFDRCAEDGFAAFDDDLTWSGAMTILAIAAGSIGDGDRSAAIRAHLAPWSGRLSWVATCSLGPIDEGLALAAEAMGDDEAAAAHRDRATAVLARLRR